MSFPAVFLQVLLYAALGLTLCGAGALVLLWFLDMREKRLW